MNKKQLLRKIRTRARITNVESEAFLKAFCHILTNQLANDNEVAFQQFGKFYTVLPAKRNIKLPNTAETTTIKPKRKVRFKSFSALDELINSI